MQFRCRHCEKTVAKGESTTAIISGTLGEASLDEFKEFYVFHDNCFVEVGGEEYSPAVKAREAQKEKTEYVPPEQPLWKKDIWP